jgi:hypothetical protein
MRWRPSVLALSLVLLAVLDVAPARAQRVVEITFTPAERAQIAIWLETADGEFVQTLRLTEATALRGIGNRPGALQMNSGFHWPYGRREGVLPIWAHRRAAASVPFKRVIFQDRRSEGLASRTSNDASPDDYYCLSFNSSASSRDALDAVSCASANVFNSDKGRFITAEDMDAGYAEPFETEGGAMDTMRALDMNSLYPPRRDVPALRGADHPDVLEYIPHVREVMPDIDAVTMATLAGGATRTLHFAPADEVPDGDYVMYVEVNVEGDYNDNWDPERFPTPLGRPQWDSWAETFGYPYRGQPSVLYAVEFTLSRDGGTWTATTPLGYGSIHGEDGDVHPMDGTISDDPDSATGSGADRLFAQDADDSRVRVFVLPMNVCGSPDPPPGCFEGCDETRLCMGDLVCNDDAMCVGLCELETRPGAIQSYEVELDPDSSWVYANVRFDVPESRRGVRNYALRVATEPFTEGMDFGSWGVEAKIAGLAEEAVIVPNDGVPGERVEVALGHLMPQTVYHIGLRATDSCGIAGDVVTAEIETTEIIFTTVSPCFVATATYGSPMADEIGVLRRFRDRHLRNHAAGEGVVKLYERFGPIAADWIRDEEDARAVVRSVLDPVVAAIRWLLD